MTIYAYHKYMQADVIVFVLSACLSTLKPITNCKLIEIVQTFNIAAIFYLLFLTCILFFFLFYNSAARLQY
jgi:hypothetical protein